MRKPWSGEFPVDRAEDMDEAAVEILARNMAAGRAEPLADRDDRQPFEWSESAAGERARERWAESYDDLDGAPEGDDDR